MLSFCYCSAVLFAIVMFVLFDFLQILCFYESGSLCTELLKTSWFLAVFAPSCFSWFFGVALLSFDESESRFVLLLAELTQS